MQQTLKTLIPLTLVFSLLVATNFIYAVWNPPQATPPLLNAPAPINTSSSSQSKSGDLSLGGTLQLKGTNATDWLEIRPGKKKNTVTSDYTTLEMPGTDTLFIWDNLEVENTITSNQGVRSSSYCDDTGSNCFSASDVASLVSASNPLKNCFLQYTSVWDGSNTNWRSLKLDGLSHGGTSGSFSGKSIYNLDYECNAGAGCGLRMKIACF